MSLEKSEINKILIVSLTNIGDVILTFPVVDILKRDFPAAKISMIIGPKAASLLKDNPIFEEVYIYDKRQPFLKTLSWVFALRKERFDLVVDLRNTAIPFLISPKHRTSCFVKNSDSQHMKEKHLQRFKNIWPYDTEAKERQAIYVSQEDQRYVEQLIKKEMGEGKRFVIVAPGAADHTKRWTEKEVAQACDRLIEEYHVQTVFVGDQKDKQVAGEIAYLMQREAINLCGRTTLVQLAELLKHCQCVITNDSASMHLASYLDCPVLAIFGPSDPRQYGPWSSKSCFFKEQRESKTAKQAGDDGTIHGITSSQVLKALSINDREVTFRK